MVNTKTTHKKLKKILKRLLSENDFDIAIDEIKQYPVKQAINPLISFLCSGEKQLEQNAIKAIGIVVSKLANENVESARVIMRRLMWSLNDESGGIGWGAPEAMAEIMTKNAKLADEYYKILLSYSRPGPNYLEHQSLRESVLQGLERLQKVRPDLLRNNEDEKI